MADREDERSPQARERAERALVWLLYQLRDETIDLIILGGLVPPTLSSEVIGDVPMHLGTADVDVLLITHLAADRDLSAVEAALEDLEFSPVDDSGWRWRVLVEGTIVRIEFLCDLDGYREAEIIRPPGCTILAAANLRGTGYVALDFESRELTGALPDGTVVTVTGSFAGVQGYLLSKCVAARTRGADKDFYDLAYVVLHNRSGGPRGAAEMLRSGSLSGALPRLQSSFLEVRERYRKTGDIGPRCYATEMRRVQPAADEATLRADAVVAMAEFFERLLD